MQACYPLFYFIGGDCSLWELILYTKKGGAVLWRLYSARCAPYFGGRVCIQGATGQFFSVSLGGIGCLMITGMYLLLVHFVLKGAASWAKIGAHWAYTGAALLPGISRSGVTISTARLLGIRAKKPLIFHFSCRCPSC